MLHAKLWQENLDLAQACLAHPFVRGLRDGTLDQAAFKRYIAQDALFLRAFLRAYAIALAKVEPLDHARRLLGFVSGVLDELKLHASYAATLGIDLAHIRPLPAARAYTDFLLRTAWQAGAGETMAAMTPCMKLYTWLGQQLAPALRPGHPYERWIQTYASPEFEHLASDAERLLDEVADDAPAVHDAYRYAMQCELDFFSAPLEPAA
jgi:thiaminase/transcriptional activator TenA